MLYLLSPILAVAMMGQTSLALDAPQSSQKTSLGWEFATYQPTEKEEVYVNPSHSDFRGTLSLKQAHAMAMLRNFEMKSQAWHVRKTEALEWQARTRNWPEASMALEDFAGSGAFEGARELQTTLELSQKIELSKKRQARAKHAKSKVQVADWEFEAKRTEIMRQVSMAYIEVVAAQREVLNSDSAMRLYQKIAEDLESRVKAGRSGSAEAAKAHILVAKSQIEREWSFHRLEEAREGLAALWGDDEPLFETAEDHLDSLADLLAFDSLTPKLAFHPEVQKAEAEIEAESNSMALEQALATSDLALSGGFRFRQAFDEHAWVAGISMSLPSKNRNLGRVLETKRHVLQSRHHKDAISLHLRGRLAEAHAMAKTAREEIRLLKSVVLSKADSANQVMQAGFSQGRYSYLEVLDAQRTLVEARQQYLRALSDFHFAVAEIEALCGKSMSRLSAFSLGIP
jgi:outer membrane protein, heavy metal efflux system